MSSLSVRPDRRICTVVSRRRRGGRTGHTIRASGAAIVASLVLLALAFSGSAMADVRTLTVGKAPTAPPTLSGVPDQPDLHLLNVQYDSSAGTLAVSMSFYHSLTDLDLSHYYAWWGLFEAGTASRPDDPVRSRPARDSSTGSSTCVRTSRRPPRPTRSRIQRPAAIHPLAECGRDDALVPDRQRRTRRPGPDLRAADRLRTGDLNGSVSLELLRTRAAIAGRCSVPSRSLQPRPTSSGRSGSPDSRPARPRR